MRGLRLPDRLRNFSRRGFFQQLWFVPVWVGLGLASLAISIMPFRFIASCLGRYNGIDVPEMRASKAEEIRALQIRRTVQLAVHYAPWRADCYPQAIVARALLGLYGLPFVLCMGLRNDCETGQVQAHAWIRCGEITITGGDSDDNNVGYRIVSVFTDDSTVGARRS